MAKHGNDAPEGALSAQRLLVGTAVLALVALVAWIVAEPVGNWIKTVRASATTCPQTTVNMVVAPEIQSTVQQILAPAQGRHLLDQHCLQVKITGQSPRDTVQSASFLPADRAPQIWIPDTSLWAGQVKRWPLQTGNSFASSPIVMASSRAVVDGLGWSQKAPTWAQALSGVKPVAIPDITANGAGLVAILALWQSLGKNQTANQAVAAAVLAATRVDAPTVDSVVSLAAQNSSQAPLMATSELNVFNANRSSSAANLVAVYPLEGSPSLDYPVLRIAPVNLDWHVRVGVDAVVEALASPAARQIVRKNGLRDVTGSGPQGGGIQQGTVGALGLPTGQELQQFLSRLQTLSVPSRMLVVVDVSLSMKTPLKASGGLTRIQLAGRAAVAAGSIMSDKSSVGLWLFSRHFNGGPRPYGQASPLEPLGTPESGTTHRQVIVQQLLGMGRYLGGDGTALYSTGLDAMKYMLDPKNNAYDPRAVNSVVLFTDGQNDDPGGLGLNEYLTQLKSVLSPDKPLRLIAVGIGPDADIAALKAMAEPTGGAAYAAPQTPDELRTVLFDALAHRPGSPA